MVDLGSNLSSWLLAEYSKFIRDSMFFATFMKWSPGMHRAALAVERAIQQAPTARRHQMYHYIHYATSLLGCRSTLWLKEWFSCPSKMKEAYAQQIFYWQTPFNISIKIQKHWTWCQQPVWFDYNARHVMLWFNRAPSILSKTVMRRNSISN